MIYSIYSLLNGKIERIVKCDSSILHLQFDKLTQAAIEGEFRDDTYYIEKDIPTLIPPKPSENHTFDYDIKQWVDLRTAGTEWPLVRAERNKLLAASDWTQLPDVPIATKEAWATYRQALRDITNQPDPFNIVWPEPPQ